MNTNSIRLWLGALLLVTVSASKFSGRITGLPDEAIEVAQYESPVVNGHNLQSRFEIVLNSLSQSSLQEIRIPVKENYEFITDISEGEYQLELTSHDFNIEVPRYKVVVAGDKITAIEDKLAFKNDMNPLEVNVSEDNPLQVRVLNAIEYYETSDGRLGAMLMNSPFGAIFRNRTYTILFVICLVVMAAPTVLSSISPELAAEFKQAQYSSTIEKPKEDNAQKTAETIKGSANAQLSGISKSKAKKRK